MKLLLLTFLMFKISFAMALDLLDTAWQTQQQIAKAQYDAGKFEASAQLFGDKSWQANALYKAGEFEDAAEHFKALGQHYNYGNTLAQQAKYDKAIKAYGQIDKNSADYTDAQHNLGLVKQLQQQEKKQEQQKDSKQDDKDKDKDEDKDSKEKNKSSDKNDKEQEQKKQQEEQDKKDQDKQQESEGESEKDKQERQEKEEKEAKDGKEGEEGEDVKKKSEEKRKSIKQQIDKQRLEQIFKQVKTQPIDLLKQKFLIEQRLRQQNNSAFSNTRGQASW